MKISNSRFAQRVPVKADQDADARALMVGFEDVWHGAVPLT
jgi:hypothetical protein